MLEQIWTITRNTFMESLRRPIFLVVLLLGILALIMAPAISGFTMGQQSSNKLMLDMGLSVILAGGMVLAAFTAAGVLSREIRNKTVLTVISKPVSRPAFALGKFLGVAGALAVALWIWSIIFLLAARHNVMYAASDTYDMVVLTFGFGAMFIALGISVWGNYFYGWVFTSRFTGLLALCLSIGYLGVLLIGKGWEFQPITTDLNAQIFIALFLVLEAVLMLCAVAVACSTRLGQVMTLVICSAVFVVGLSSDYMFGRFADYNAFAKVLYSVSPNMGFLWQAGALTRGVPITWEYVGIVTAYSVLWAASMLFLAMALFQTREAG